MTASDGQFSRIVSGEESWTLRQNQTLLAERQSPSFYTQPSLDKQRQGLQGRKQSRWLVMLARAAWKSSVLEEKRSARRSRLARAGAPPRLALATRTARGYSMTAAGAFGLRNAHAR